jgi:hypothetical protein
MQAWKTCSTLVGNYFEIWAGAERVGAAGRKAGSSAPAALRNDIVFFSGAAASGARLTPRPGLRELGGADEKPHFSQRAREMGHPHSQKLQSADQEFALVD